MAGLSLEQIEVFERDGVVCLRGQLDAVEIRKLRDACSQQIASLGHSGSAFDLEQLSRHVWIGKAETGGHVRNLGLERFHRAVREDMLARPMLEAELDVREGSFFCDTGGIQKFEGLRDVAFDSSLPETVARLLGAAYLHFWQDATFVKCPGTRQKTAFHQKASYYELEGNQCAVVWVPLDTCTLANGTFEYVRGSHLWGQRYAPNALITTSPVAKGIGARCPDIDRDRAAYDIVSFDVEPGDVAISDFRTVHGAGGNMSATMRRSMTLSYCGERMRYRRPVGATIWPGKPTLPGETRPLLRTGHPLVWPRPFPDFRVAAHYRPQTPATDHWTGADTELPDSVIPIRRHRS